MIPATCRCEPCQRRAIRRQFSEQGCYDVAVCAALRLLRQIEPDPAKIPDLRMIRVRPIDNTTTAIVLIDRQSRMTITVDPASAFYLAARDNDPLPLALVLAHEQFHVVNGSAEAPAYADTLRLARQADAPADLIALIEDIAASNG